MYYVDYDPFVLPFTLGGLIMLVILLSKFFRWWDKLLPEDRIIIRTGLRSGKLFSILNEVFMESLIHRKMFRQNPLLGYMHMTFAFGWFTLIVIGNLESRIHSGIEFNLPYYPIFFKFFVQDPSITPFSAGFAFLMDLFLLLIITGLFLAWVKRINAGAFGMKRPTHPDVRDRLALTALWFIFPLRLLAESFTAGVKDSGGFLTGTLGKAIASFLPVEWLAYPAWWAYSVALSVFFVILPFSRYMHIPAEVLLIYLRKLGFTPGKDYDYFSVVEVNACPSCGVCIEKCQLKTSLGHSDIAPAHFLRNVKREKPAVRALEECLLCGRCQQVCPVGIHVNDVRQQRRQIHYPGGGQDYAFIHEPLPARARVVYYAGCMTHLTPGIKLAMENLLKEAGTDYVFLDREGGICCGRPLQMAGQWEQARQLIVKNTRLIRDTGAGTFVTSCPICLKVFRNEYKLDIEVLHHSQYLLRLLEAGRLKTGFTPLEAAYHDPCELGRGCGVMDEPRALIGRMAALQETSQEREYSLCCGGSLGSLSLSAGQRNDLRMDTLDSLLRHHPDLLVTACPLCKKTFQSVSPVPVKDIAELTAQCISATGVHQPQVEKSLVHA